MAKAWRADEKSGSFYFRIGATFVVFLIAVVVAQSAIFSLMARGGGLVASC